MPITETVYRESKARSGIALGGTGAGSIELRKDGIFYNWSIFNNLSIFGGPRPPYREDSSLFFTARYCEEGGRPRMKLLQIDEGDHPAGIDLQFYSFPWLSGVDRIDYTGVYPFAELKFTDEDMPFEIVMKAWHPFIPHDVDDSCLPGVFFDFKIKSLTDKKVDVLLMANMRHMTDYQVKEKLYASKINSGPDGCSVEMFCKNSDETAESHGQTVLASPGDDSSYDAGWSHRHNFYEEILLSTTLPGRDCTDDQNGDDEELGIRRAMHNCISTVGRTAVLNGKGSSFEHSFALSWFFPNLYSDATKKTKAGGGDYKRRLEGHYYANLFGNAGEVMKYMIGKKDELSRKTHAFRNHFYDSSIPEFVLDQVNSNFNTFSTSAWFTKEGDYGIQEGLTADQAWGPLATIDVGMYGGISAAYLFPELDRRMLEVHRRLQFDSGDVCHGIGRNFGTGDHAEGVKSRLDLAIQYAIMTLRHYFFTGDKEYFEKMWPSARKALYYTRDQRDTDGDGLPEMAGSNSTYDNFPMFGPASCISSQWLSALQYGIAAAEEAGDAKCAKDFRETLSTARKTFECKLWNGEYYILYNDEDGEKGDRDEGCLSDQLMGQWSGRHAGFEDICDPGRIRHALKSVLERNFIEGEGLHNCRWPNDEWLHSVDENCWWDQANTYWTGVELEFASFLIYEGMLEKGLAVIRAVDDRHRKAGRYWDHQEWGGHYYRAMSAYAIVNAFLGFGVKRNEYHFEPRLTEKNFRLFFSHGTGTGHFIRAAEEEGETSTIRIHDGEMRIERLVLGSRKKSRVSARIFLDGQECPADIGFRGSATVVDFSDPPRIGPGGELKVIL